MNSLKRGYIHIYTGNGKGKTTAALGQALRAAGSGLTTFMVMFMKGFSYGEIRIVKRLTFWIRLEQYGDDAFVIRKDKPDCKDITAYFLHGGL
jgi:cob(I)alamin adenosyltransferase